VTSGVSAPLDLVPAYIPGEPRQAPTSQSDVPVDAAQSESAANEPAVVSCNRRRWCLLKGCEQAFCPQHPLERYCSDDCLAEARRWSRARANQKYRASESGRQRRQAQCRRRRERCRQACVAPEEPSPAASEGYQETDSEKNLSCSRPGCYERFAASARSPLRKFCCPCCRQALRRVLVRESRWRRRLGMPPLGRWRQAASHSGFD
jgi:hypothetical protein